MAAYRFRLLYSFGEGTGKTLLARACAAQTNACYLKLAGPSLVQMFIGDGAKLVRDAFKLAKEKAPAIIFIDELDAIGTKRFDSDKSGDREVQRTMLELLNQLDGFSSDERIKVRLLTPFLPPPIQMTCRSLPPPIVLTFLILRSFALDDSIAKLSSHCRRKRPAHVFLRSTPAR